MPNSNTQARADPHPGGFTPLCHADAECRSEVISRAVKCRNSGARICRSVCASCGIETDTARVPDISSCSSPSARAVRPRLTARAAFVHAFAARPPHYYALSRRSSPSCKKNTDTPPATAGDKRNAPGLIRFAQASATLLHGANQHFENGPLRNVSLAMYRLLKTLDGERHAGAMHIPGITPFS